MPRNKPFVKVSTTYMYVLTELEILTLLEGERDIDIDDTLHAQLSDVEGVDNIDYDWHFGCQITFDLEGVHDTPEIQEHIYQMIVRQLERLYAMS